MKKTLILFIAIATAISFSSYAQTNTYPWPTSGSIGIGTTTPAYPLEIIQYILHGDFGALNLSNSYNGGDGNTSILFDGGNAKITSSQIGTPGASSRHLDFFTNNGASTNQVMRINSNGNVGIGTTNPDEKLAVNGTIHSQEVRVDLTGWEDKVFKRSYKLPTLSTVKTYIDLNHHLPDMPSEQELLKSGLNLGNMQKILTKKVEELTLHLIEKERLIEEQKQNNIQQQKQIDQLKRQMGFLINKMRKN